MEKRQILEVGPGKRPFINERVKRKDPNYIPGEIIYAAIDLFIMFGTIEECRKRLEQVQGLEFNLIEANMLTHLETLPTSLFDEIHFHRVFDLHKDLFDRSDKRDFLKMLLNLCKPGGLLVISEDWEEYLNENHYFSAIASIQQASDALQEVGFKEVERIILDSDLGYGTAASSLLKMRRTS